MPTDRHGREFRPRDVVNAIARHVEAGEWVSFGQIAEVVELLTGHSTTGKGVGSALNPVAAGGYVAFRVRQVDGSFESYDHGEIAMSAVDATLLARAEGICDETGAVRMDRRLGTSMLAARAERTVQTLLDS
jgi:hypothetical protein